MSTCEVLGGTRKSTEIWKKSEINNPVCVI